MRKANDRMGAALIIAFVMTLYAGIIGPYVRFSDNVLPMGDPFTYTYSWVLLLDLAQQDYWAALARALEANWYWMMNLPIAILSPVLVKEPFSLAVVNFVAFGFATLAFFRLARHLGYTTGAALVSSLFLWLFPINFGFLDYSSIPVVSLDPIFVALLHVTVANVLLFALEPFKLRNAVWAGLAAGLAIWGRGSSIPVVGMVTFCPVLVAVYTLWQRNRTRFWTHLPICGAIPLAMAAFFFWKQGGPIATYYDAHAAFVERHVWNLNDAMPYLKNVPGFFFWRVEDSAPTIALTWVLHLLTAATPLVVWRLAPATLRRALSLIAVTGTFIYFVTYVANIALFTDPHMTIYNALLVYAPMRIGMVLCAFAVVGASAARRLRFGVAVPAMVLVVMYGVWLTKVQTPTPAPGMPTPREVEGFAKGLDSLSPNGTVSVLWYRHYNPAILRYYRVKNNLPDLMLFRSDFHDDIWSQYDYSEEKRLKVRQELGDHLREADVIIIPEYVDYYSLDYPYSFYKFRDEFPRFLNDPDNPRFVVRMILQEYQNQRLLVLQRESEAAGSGEPLKLPYGPSSQPHSDYGPSVVRFAP